MKTFSAKPHEVQHDWYLVDGTDKVLGRLASEIARRLRGKHKAIFTPHVDTGDYIVVVNVDKIRVTGNKAEDKKYYRHSTGYPGWYLRDQLRQDAGPFPRPRAGEGRERHVAQGSPGLRHDQKTQGLCRW
jgi:large subunit ribosomal protein L13